MPAADPIQICRNPFDDEQEYRPPPYIHQLAQIQFADGSTTDAYYNSESKKVIIERNNVYYECPRELTMIKTLDLIIGLQEDAAQISDESWAEMGEIHDSILTTSWKRLRRRHRALQLVFV